MEQVVRADSAHGLARGSQESLVQRVSVPSIGFDDEKIEMRPMGVKDFSRTVRDSSVDDHVLERWVVPEQD